MGQDTLPSKGQIMKLSVNERSLSVKQRILAGVLICGAMVLAGALFMLAFPRIGTIEYPVRVTVNYFNSDGDYYIEIQEDGTIFALRGIRKIVDGDFAGASLPPEEHFEIVHEGLKSQLTRWELIRLRFTLALLPKQSTDDAFYPVRLGGHDITLFVNGQKYVDPTDFHYFSAPYRAMRLIMSYSPVMIAAPDDSLFQRESGARVIAQAFPVGVWYQDIEGENQNEQRTVVVFLDRGRGYVRSALLTSGYEHVLNSSDNLARTFDVAWFDYSYEEGQAIYITYDDGLTDLFHVSERSDSYMNIEFESDSRILENGRLNRHFAGMPVFVVE